MLESLNSASTARVRFSCAHDGETRGPWSCASARVRAPPADARIARSRSGVGRVYSCSWGVLSVSLAARRAVAHHKLPGAGLNTSTCFCVPAVAYLTTGRHCDHTHWKRRAARLLPSSSLTSAPGLSISRSVRPSHIGQSRRPLSQLYAWSHGAL